MKKLLLAIGLAAGLPAAPVIAPNGAVNAASNRLVGAPGSGIARGGFFSAYGTGLGPASGAVPTAFPLQTSLAGVSIRVSLGATTVDAIPVFASATQVNGIMPSNAPLGRVSMTITYQNETSAPVTVEVVAVSFGLITLSAGAGQAVIQNVAADGGLTLNTPSNSARPQQLMQGYGTGMGAITAPDNQAPPAGDLNVVTEILVGGRPARRIYAGRSPCCAGLDQLNFEIPEDAPLGCFVPLVVRAGEFWSNVATLAISASGGACRDELGYLGAGGGSRSVGVLTLQRTNLRLSLLGLNFDSNTDTGSANFFRADDSFYHLEFAPPPAGSCSVSIMRAAADPTNVSVPPPANLLDAGSPLRITGPVGERMMPRQPAGNYSATLGGGTGLPGQPPPAPLYLSEGRYSVAGPGAANVGAFTANVMVSPLANWTNRDQISSVNRSQPVTVTWSESGNSQEVILVTGLSIDATQSALVSFTCMARPAARSFTIPAWVLSSLPVSGTFSGVPTGALAVGGATLVEPATFTAPGLDRGVISYTLLTARILGYQ